MKNEKRRNQRKAIERRAWVDRSDGSRLMECALGNMSDTGAKLVFTEPTQLPEEFICGCRWTAVWRANAAWRGRTATMWRPVHRETRRCRCAGRWNRCES